MRQTRTSLRSLSVANSVSPGEKNVGSIVAGAAPPEPQPAVPSESHFQNTLSAAMMTGIAFLPIVIAAGFLAEHFQTQAVPREISMAAFRGPLDIDRPATADAQSADRSSLRPAVRVGAGL